MKEIENKGMEKRIKKERIICMDEGKLKREEWKDKNFLNISTFSFHFPLTSPRFKGFNFSSFFFPLSTNSFPYIQIKALNFNYLDQYNK